jgi:hypothetical protein
MARPSCGKRLAAAEINGANRRAEEPGKKSRDKAVTELEQTRQEAQVAEAVRRATWSASHKT